MFPKFFFGSGGGSKKFTEFKPGEPVDKAGSLLKKGSLNRWKEKWFVVQASSLFEFSSQKDLSVYSKISLDDTIIETIELKKKPFAFTVAKNNNGTGGAVLLTLRAASEEALLEWMQSLLKASVLSLVKAPPIPSKPLPAVPPQTPARQSTASKKEEEERRRKELLNRRIARLQATWKARKQRTFYLEILKLSKHRLRIVNELLETERSYLGYLAILIEIYQKPLDERVRQPVTKQTPSLGLTPDDVSKIFSDVEIIFNIHRMLRMELEERIQNWYPQQKLAPIFNYLVSSMKSYAQYVNNYDIATSTLENLKKTKPLFVNFLEESAKNSGLQPGLDLFSLLIMPIQRPPRLCMLLRDLLSKTWKGHEDEEDLREAVGQMEAVTVFLNESKRQAENRNKVFSIQQKLQETGREHILELLQPHRRYLAEGSLIQLTNGDKKQKERYVFLFNDILLISRKTAINKGGLMSNKRMTTRFVIDHTKQAVVLLERFVKVEASPDTKHHKHIFTLLGPSSPSSLVPPTTSPSSPSPSSSYCTTPASPRDSSSSSSSASSYATSPASLPSPSSPSSSPSPASPASLPMVKPLRFSCDTEDHKQLWIHNIELALKELTLQKQRSGKSLLNIPASSLPSSSSSSASSGGSGGSGISKGSTIHL